MSKVRAQKAGYEPSKVEWTIIERQAARQAGTSDTPALKFLGEDGRKVELDHPDRVVGRVVLMEALGIRSPSFLDGLIKQVSGIDPARDGINANFALEVIKSVKPNGQLETMLATQMAATHLATMTLARKLAHADDLVKQDSAERALNKLARTFALQLEALDRHRRGCEQPVLVQNVSVNDGGQAIVGNVQAAGTRTTSARSSQSATSTPPFLTDDQAPAMPILDNGRDQAHGPGQANDDGEQTSP